MKDTYKLNNGTTVYVTPETFETHAVEFEAISDYLFKHCRNLHSLDFSDVSAGGIQVGGVHEYNPGYIMMHRTIKYDWSNINEVIRDFVKSWNEFMEEDVAAFKRFTDDGEKYGWD